MLLNGKNKMIKNLKMGDVLSSGDVIRCVVQSDCPNGRASLVQIRPEKGSFESPSIAPSGNELKDLYVTPWHPVKLCGVWRFPTDLCSPVEIDCPAVYSFLVTKSSENVRERKEGIVFENGTTRHIAPTPSSSVPPSPSPYASSMCISGIECATLAHCIVGQEVISHPFYGTLRVVEDLQRCRGWILGQVRFAASSSISGSESQFSATCCVLDDCGSQDGECSSISGSNSNYSDSVSVWNLSGPGSRSSAGHDKVGTLTGCVLRDGRTGLASGFILSAEI